MSNHASNHAPLQQSRPENTQKPITPITPRAQNTNHAPITPITAGAITHMGVSIDTHVRCVIAPTDHGCAGEHCQVCTLDQIIASSPLDRVHTLNALRDQHRRRAARFWAGTEQDPT